MEYIARTKGCFFFQGHVTNSQTTFVHVCAEVQVSEEPRGVGSGATVDYDLPDMDSGNQVRFSARAVEGFST